MSKKTNSMDAFFGGSDDDEEEEQQQAKQKKPLNLYASFTTLAAEDAISKAQEMDPSIYDYDAHFDQVAQKREQGKQDKQKQNLDQQNKPKYINHLLQVSQDRRDYLNRVKDKRAMKEMEREGNVNVGPVFVTTGYAKKLQQDEVKEKQEMQQEEQMKSGAMGMTNFKMQLLAQSSRMQSISDEKKDTSSNKEKLNNVVATNTMTSDNQSKKRPREEEKNVTMTTTMTMTVEQQSAIPAQEQQPPAKVAKQSAQDSIAAAKERAMARLRGNKQ